MDRKRNVNSRHALIHRARVLKNRIDGHALVGHGLVVAKLADKYRSVIAVLATKPGQKQYKNRTHVLFTGELNRRNMIT